MTKTLKSIALLSLMSLTSCALFTTPLTHNGAKGEAQVSTAPAAANAVANSDKQSATTTTATTTDKNKAHAAKAPELKMDALNGEWVIVKVGKDKIVRDDNMPYINFVEKEKRFYASNGCNILNGSYALTSTNEIQFGQVISSLMSCPDVKFEGAINKVLADGVTVKIDFYQKGQESYIDLKNHSGNTLLVLRRHNMDKLNGKWQILKVDNIAIGNPEINLFLDIPEYKIHGNTGCNYFNGAIIIDPNVASSISFSQMAVTMRLCENSDIEIALLVALEQTSNYRLDNNYLYFLDSEGKILVTLHKE